MPSAPVARKGDPVFCPADAHGQVVVPVSGLIESGADTVYANNLKVAVADGQKHKHVACSGAQNFELESGQSVAYAEGQKIVRSGDPTNHCGSAPPGQKGTVLPFCSLDVFA